MRQLYGGRKDHERLKMKLYHETKMDFNRIDLKKLKTRQVG